MAESEELLPDEPIEVWFADERLFVRLHDGRSIGIPLWWYPSLLKANARERENFELSAMGVHWPDVDEDISIASMIAGAKAPGAVRPAVAAE